MKEFEVLIYVISERKWLEIR